MLPSGLARALRVSESVTTHESRPPLAAPPLSHSHFWAAKPQVARYIFAALSLASPAGTCHRGRHDTPASAGKESTLAGGHAPLRVHGAARRGHLRLVALLFRPSIACEAPRQSQQGSTRNRRRLYALLSAHKSDAVVFTDCAPPLGWLACRRGEASSCIVWLAGHSP